MDETKFQEKVFEEFKAISLQLKGISTHAEYTKKDVEENKADIKEMKKDIVDHDAKINSLEEFRQAFKDVVWEVLKGPLRTVGVVIVLAIGIVGIVLYLS